MRRIWAIVLIILVSAVTAPVSAQSNKLKTLLPETPDGWAAHPITVANVFGGERIGRRYYPKRGGGQVGIFYQWRGIEIKQYREYITDPAKARAANLQTIEIGGQRFVWRQSGSSFVFATVVAGQVAITLQGLSTTRAIVEGFIKRINFRGIAEAVTSAKGASGPSASSGASPKGGASSGSSASFGAALVKLLPGPVSGFKMRRKPRWKKYRVGGEADVTHRKGGGELGDIVISYLWKSASQRSRAKLLADAGKLKKSKYRIIDIGGRKFLIRSYDKKTYTRHYVYALPGGDVMVQFAGNDRAAIDAYAKVVPYDELAKLAGGGTSGARSPSGGSGAPKVEKAEPGGEARPRAEAEVQSCPPTTRDLRLAPGRKLKCACAPGMVRGRVWGSGRYTADSSVCLAAVHAGVVGRTGGTVGLYVGGGCPRFVGTMRNGVRSGRWGNYGSTYAFRYPLPRCFANTPNARPGTQAGACDPSVGGKYQTLLRRIRVPRDARRYGRCRDYGRYSGSSWAGFRNLPPGFWVYSFPHWYIWSRRTR